MLSWKVLHRFIEGMNQEPVVWFEEDYSAAKNGEKHHSGHPEIGTHFDVIKEAIENPDEVRQDRNEDKRKCYYARFAGDKTYTNQYMKVVLEHTWYGKIRVLTAYFTAHFPLGEETIWSRT